MTRPRLFVLTDITSVEAGVREPDDAQSMIRLMLYACDFEIEGLAATSNLGHGRGTRPELIARIVEAYGLVQPNLARHDPRYPRGDALLRTIVAGNPLAGRDVPVEACVGEAFDSDASRALIAALGRDDPRPLWVVVWGGTADLAQALWRMRRDLPREAFAGAASRLRIVAIGDQDATGPWIRAQFPEVWHWLKTFCYRGMYRGGDATLVSSDWVRTHLHLQGSPLGLLYPDYRGGDIWSATLGPVRGIKEGDTPSFLSLVPIEQHRALLEASDPTQPGWGGLAAAAASSPRHFVDVPDPVATPAPEDRSPLMSSVYRWRPQFQADFARRMRQTIDPPLDAA